MTASMQTVRTKEPNRIAVKKRRMDGLYYRMTARKITYILLLTVTAACACQVPVFRYALERWEPGSYQLRVPDGAQILLPVEPVNVEIEKSADVTQLELLFPPKLRQAAGPPVWSGPLSEENMRRVFDSPLRQELRQRLLAGESAVWLLLESGDAAKDDAAAQRVAKDLQAAQEKLKLPDGVITQDEANEPGKRRENADVLQSDLPLKIEFSLLRVSRENVEEVALIAMLMRLEPDLGDYVAEPMVFPIFGRGRALEPLIGKGINADNVFDAASYLCGACSCEIKEQNPGIDLLMAADWEPVASKEKVETVRIMPATATAVDKDSRMIIRVVLIGGAVASLLKGWLLARRSLNRRDKSN